MLAPFRAINTGDRFAPSLGSFPPLPEVQTWLSDPTSRHTPEWAPPRALATFNTSLCVPSSHPEITPEWHPPRKGSGKSLRWTQPCRDIGRVVELWGGLLGIEGRGKPPMQTSPWVTPLTSVPLS